LNGLLAEGWVRGAVNPKNALGVQDRNLEKRVRNLKTK